MPHHHTKKTVEEYNSSSSDSLENVSRGTQTEPVRVSKSSVTFVNNISNAPRMEQNLTRQQRIDADIDSSCCDCFWSLFKK